MNKLCIIHESWRIDAFELWCWRRLLRIPWTAWKSNQSTIKEINPDYSLTGLMLKLKLHYVGHPDVKNRLTGKDLMLRKIEGMRRRGQQRMRWLDDIINSRDMNLCKLRDIVKDREAWHAAVHKVAKTWTWLSDWTRISTEIPSGHMMFCCKPLRRPRWPSSDETGCWGWILHKMVGFHGRLENDFLQLVCGALLWGPNNSSYRAGDRNLVTLKPMTLEQ